MMSSGGYADIGDAARLYDLTAAYRGDVDFYLGIARRAGGTVLDLGCGTGRILLRLAEAGFEVVGVDFSQPMLGVCREKVSRESPDVQKRIELVHADMARFAVARSFRLVILPYRSFQYLTSTEDQLSCLACVRSHLEPGGLLALDVFNPSVHFLASEHGAGNAPEWEEYDTLPDGTRVAIADNTTGVDLLQQIVRGTTLFRLTRPDGSVQTSRHEYAMRYIFRYELEHLLARAGFKITELYSGFDLTPYG